MNENKNIEVFTDEVANLIVEKVVHILETEYEIKWNPIQSWSWEEECETLVFDFLSKIGNSESAYFIWGFCEEKGWILKDIDDDLKDIINIILGGKKKLYNKFVRYLEADVKVSLLAKTVEDLTNKMNKDAKKNASELFYSYENWKAELGITIKDFADESQEYTIIDKLHDYPKNINHKYTKDLIYFHSAILANSKIYYSILFERPLEVSVKEVLYNISDGYPKLVNYKIDNQLIVDSQQLMNYYISKLNEKKFKYNKSLNFYFFNNSTKLYDLNIITNVLAKKSRIAKNFSIYPLKEYTKKSNVFYNIIKNLCRDSIDLVNYNGILTKELLIKVSFDNKIMDGEMLYKAHSNIYNKCLEDLGNVISNVSSSQEEKSREHFIYDELIKEDPYESHLKKFEQKIKKINEKAQSTKDLMWKEFYFYNYLAVYDAFVRKN
ncbi:hypothetical protein [Bacillus ndiopicus]|uniref:hypothetical protein n=1 Tax=Bacillus ndiopicus TaxID=1347368 RepID=UPI0005A63C07|nr:hypothetical protein [Bacillus ndiopicus]